MELHPTAHILPFLERLAKDIRGCQGGTLYQEIARWRKTDPEFKERYRDLADGRHALSNSNHGEALALEFREGMEEWRFDAAMAYLHSRSKVTAANAAGISPSHLRGKLNPRGPDHDPELAHLFLQVDTILLWAKETDLEWAISEAKAQGDVRTVGQLCLAVLERLDKSKWSKSEEVNHRHSGTVVLEHVVAERRERAMEAAGSLSRALFGPREPVASLPAPREAVEVIDAEYEEVHAAKG
jgi:hypothetical protein